MIIYVVVNDSLDFWGFFCLKNADVNECGNDTCHANATCNNTIGSFMCICDRGFTGDGFNCSGRNH